MKSFLRHTASALAIAAALTAGSASAKDKLETEKDKVSYMVGMDVAKSLTTIKDELDSDVVAQAIKTVLSGGQPLMNEADAEATRTAFMQKLQAKQAAEQTAMAENNKQAGETFLAQNKTKAGVQMTTSGLQYQVLRQGNGPKPTATDTVKVHYAGTLLDGTKFDSSYDRGQPAQFVLNQVVPGWTEGVQLMPTGSKYKFWIPSELAYGERGPGPIGPNATLVFEVELLEVVK
jgi:FKBP-type peptidyl-prolyl cis-trans isomerase FkpA